MPDREKVIAALEKACRDSVELPPFVGLIEITKEAIEEGILPFLREQEPTEYVDDGPDFINGTIARRWKCKACGQTATNEEGKAPTAIRYCFRCGRAVKWDG